MKRLLLIPILLLVGCLPDGLTDYDFRALQPPQPDRPGPRQFERIAEAEVGAQRVVVYAEGGARAGHVRLKIGVAEADGRLVENARLTLAAEVARGETLVPAPSERPPSERPDAEGYHAATVVLLPDRADAPARLTVEVAEQGTAVLDLTLAADPLAVRRTASDGLVYHGVWARPVVPLVGENAFEAQLWREIEGGFVPLTGAAVSMYPYMDMGGGDGHSTPFTPPTEAAPGAWTSRVNFIMSGGWELSLYVARAGAARDTVLFAPFLVFEP